MSHQEQLRLAVFAFGIILLGRAIRLEALWRWALGALVELGIGVSKLDGDVSDLLLLMSHSLQIRGKNTRK
jgi:hypothetical protein